MFTQTSALVRALPHPSLSRHCLPGLPGVQEGSIDGCSDTSDTHLTNELMAQAEPDHRTDFDSSSISGAEQAEEAGAWHKHG